jgi:hypothetical protein
MSFSFQSLLELPGTLKQWLGRAGMAYRSAIAHQFDLVALRAELTAEARSPLLCDATVLPYHSADRLIRRYANETELSHRICLAKWKQIHASAGKAYGILRRLRIMLLSYGRPMLRFVHTTGNGGITEWFTLAPGDGTKDYFITEGTDPEFSRVLAKPGNWLWDPQASTNQWSRYYLLIYTSGLDDQSYIEWDGDGEWDDGVSKWDQGLPAEIIGDILELASDMQAANSACYGIFQVHDDAALDPAGSGAGYPDGTWQFVANRRQDVTYSYVRMVV